MDARIVRNDREHIGSHLAKGTEERGARTDVVLLAELLAERQRERGFAGTHWPVKRQKKSA